MIRANARSHPIPWLIKNNAIGQPHGESAPDSPPGVFGGFIPGEVNVVGRHAIG